MRTISLQGRNFRTTRQTVDSLAWATNRRGRITWKDSENVVAKIIRYLDDHNVKMFESQGRNSTQKHFREVIERLVAEGYVEIRDGGVHNALTMFKFMDDVDLNGHEPEFNKPGGEPMDQSPKAGLVSDIDIPLPPLPLPPRWKHEEITRLLDKWADTDADGYADWADQLVTRLGTLLDG